MYHIYAPLHTANAYNRKHYNNMQRYTYNCYIVFYYVEVLYTKIVIPINVEYEFFRETTSEYDVYLCKSYKGKYLLE